MFREIHISIVTEDHDVNLSPNYDNTISKDHFEILFMNTIRNLYS